MTYVRVKGFQIFKDRHGKTRCYHRASGTPIDIGKFPLGSLEFLAECERIQALRDRAAKSKPGTLGLLIHQYRAHRDFLELAPRTRDDYQKCFDYLHPIRDTPLTRFTPPLVVHIRDKAGEQIGVRWGNYVRTVMSVLFAWGVERGFLAANPASRIKSIRRPKDAPEANRPWEDDERNEVLAALPPHMLVPFALMMFCALDPQDAARLPRTAIDGGKINTRRGKTLEPVWLELPEPVIAIIDAAPKHDAITFCANSRGQPWTVNGLRASWRPIRVALEKAGKVRPGLTLKGLRHTVATILSEMGKDDRTIADYLGQKTEMMARHYSRRANKQRKMDAVVKDLNTEVNRRKTKVVKPS